jgi:hypothetical protein
MFRNDPFFFSQISSSTVNYLMKNGKRSLAEILFFKWWGLVKILYSVYPLIIL